MGSQAADERMGLGADQLDAEVDRVGASRLLDSGLDRTSRPRVAIDRWLGTTSADLHALTTPIVGAHHPRPGLDRDSRRAGRRAGCERLDRRVLDQR